MAASGPRIGLAYTLNRKTMLRTAFGRSFSKVTVVSGTGHFDGFIGQYDFNFADQGITPAFNLGRRTAVVYAAAELDPSFPEQPTSITGSRPTRRARRRTLYWTFSIQRQVSANTVLEAAYNANVGTHLQTGLVNLNQVPTAYLNQFDRSSTAPPQAVNTLNAAAGISSPQARAAGIPIAVSELHQRQHPADHAQRRAVAAAVSAVSEHRSPVRRAATRAATRPITPWC